MKRMTWMAMLVVAGMAMAASAEQGGERGERFKKADADGDGKLSPTEFATMCPKDADKKFATADTDKDGFLTKDELKAAHKAGGPGCGKEGGCQKGEKKAEGAPKA